MKTQYIFFQLACLIACLATIGCNNNSAPRILPIDPQIAYVSSRFELKILAQDPEDDALTLTFNSPSANINDRAQLAHVGGEWIFLWVPQGKDVGEQKIDFIVDDGHSRSSETLALTVKPLSNTENAPIFRKPLGQGTILDIAKKKCLSFDIEIEDADTTSVDITLLEPIAGAELSNVEPLKATFNWCPTAAQIEQQLFTIKLAADDHEHETPTILSYEVFIRSELGANCPGTAPVISHTAPGTITSSMELILDVTVTDDKGLKNIPVLFYSTTKPTSTKEIDFSSMQQVKMPRLPSENDKYRAGIPNPTAQLAGGQSVTIYYVIVAEDDDDATGTCDHRTQKPTSSYYQLVVTKPVGKSCSLSSQCARGEVCDGKTCVTDTCRPQDDNNDSFFFEQSTCPANYFCPQNGANYSLSHCAKSCTKDAECDFGQRCKVFDTKQGCADAGANGIGEACNAFATCSGKEMCLSWKGGYCTISNCDSNGEFSGACPTGSICAPITDERFFLTQKHYICLKNCTADADCRSTDGYSCKEIKNDLGKIYKVCM